MFTCRLQKREIIGLRREILNYKASNFDAYLQSLCLRYISKPSMVLQHKQYNSNWLVAWNLLQVIK